MLLGTWNLENLYRPGGEFGPSDKASYEAKLVSLAATISALEPGLLGIQEVGDPDALDDLTSLLSGTWHTALSQHADGRGIRVGFLSRHPLDVRSDTNILAPLVRPVQSDDDGDPAPTLGRGTLVVQIQPEQGPELQVAVCHLKSKLLSYPGKRFAPRDEDERARYGAYALFRRAAEATTMRVLADGLIDGKGKQPAVVVLGDMNDEAGAATTQILHGPPGSEIVDTVLGNLKQYSR